MKNLFGILIIGFLSGCSDDNNKILMGSKVYSNVCSSCHETGKAKNFAYNKLKLDEIIKSVTHGNQGMHSFKNVLTFEQIDAVAYYIYKKK
tara:strand:- start:185 stop:457 length:273 start_codon:yes stop_codon:yes gene_type:complete